MVKVLFVCMGNICRSPTAEGVFRRHVAEAGLDEVIEIDSAGTHAYHVGEAPDRRAQEAATRRGFSLADIRARRVGPEDFERFHYIIAMDQDNLVMLHEQAGSAHREKIRLFLEFGTGPETVVPAGSSCRVGRGSAERGVPGPTRIAMFVSARSKSTPGRIASSCCSAAFLVLQCSMVQEERPAREGNLRCS